MLLSGRSCKKEIIKRPCQAKVAFNQKKRGLFTSRNISLCIYIYIRQKSSKNIYVQSIIMLYGSKTWTFAKEEQSRTNKAYDMLCYKRILNISRTDMNANEELY